MTRRLLSVICFIFLLLLAQFSMAAGPVHGPVPPRIVAIGDLHGDLEAARSALRLAGAIDDQDHWIGDDLVVVQTGDQLDRGDQDKAILDLLLRLAGEAAADGGALHLLNGNHELMNVRLDLRYISEKGFAEFQEFAEDAEADSLLLSLPAEQRGRAAAFRPGGPYAKILSERNIFLIIGDNLFVHGGITPEHLELGLEALNEQTKAWMAGDGPCPEILHTSKSPVWVRCFSDDVDSSDCERLDRVLESLGIRRMIVGHTVQQEGISSYCDESVWCIDSGMSAYYGGPTQVLEISGDKIRILRESQPSPGK